MFYSLFVRPSLMIQQTGMNPRGIAIALFFVLLSTFVALCLGSLGIIRFPASTAPKSFKSIDPPVYNPNVRIGRVF